MARRARTARRRFDPVRLERRLILLSWLHSRLGYNDSAELLGDAGKADEGVDADGRSRLCQRLASRAGRFKGIGEGDLARYDDNVSAHLAAMNAGRREPIALRCFQRLAALYAELFLDARFSRPAETLASLNRFAAHRAPPGEPPAVFAESDLNKIAFWMATGSGKTLLLHINLRQFLAYNRKPLDNILLITPNEGLSEQHLAELAASNIPAKRFDLNDSARLLDGESAAVRVTEITKLVLEKTGEGERVPVEAFEGNNLIFVDEGHKGAGSEARAWRKVRDRLGKTGFTFEYSATFGQALAAARDDELTAEYGKSIAFDYSYRHFYNDGYGKDFRIVNLTQADDAHTDALLLASLLSFYQRQRLFAERADAMRPYNIEQPLWTLAGSKVNAAERSDALAVTRFLQRFLRDDAWSERTISRLLDGESGLRDKYGDDVFANGFGYLRETGESASALRRDILARTFHAPDGGGLRMSAIRAAKGELGLKAGNADNYFGLVYVGDANAFRRLVESDNSGVVAEDDAFSGSLFADVNEPGTTIEILIGARKFIEGWNSWRVSNMGLLNVGRSEGSQIIQMFGRGVRLKGRGMSLKRASKLVGETPPPYLDLLETLEIFAVRANYMSNFREYLEREGVAADDRIDLALPIRPNRAMLDSQLLIPRLGEGRDFKKQTVVALKYDADDPPRPVSVDMAARAQSLTGARLGEEPTDAASGAQRRIPAESLDMIDWNAVCLALMRYRADKGYDNLIVKAADLRGILAGDDPPAYTLIAEESLTNPRAPADAARLRETAIAILRKYADALYRRRRAQWESDNMVYKTLDEGDANFRMAMADGAGAGAYKVSVPRDDAELVRQIQNLLADCAKLYETESGELPRIHFDRHLYQPLLREDLGKYGLKASPPELNESEREFVDALKKRLSAKDAGGDSEFFLLRNLSRGKGVGFFEDNGFYPDFILWIKTKDAAQRIVFVEPHGMIHAPAYENDDKATLHERLQGLAKDIAARSPANADVSLDSFIISATPYEELRKKYGGDWSIELFKQAHILFPDSEGDYVADIIGGIGG